MIKRRSVGMAVVTKVTRPWPCLYDERVFEGGNEARVVAGASAGGRVSLRLTCNARKIER